jgi:hypothetical protein
LADALDPPPVVEIVDEVEGGVAAGHDEADGRKRH